MYLGLIGVGVWIAIVLLRYQKGLERARLVRRPARLRARVRALPLAAIAGPADFIWHEAYGFENQIDSTYSPPHQGLFYAGAMLATIPAASAWQRRVERADAARVPAHGVLDHLVIAVMLFVVHQILPFYGGGIAAPRGLPGRPRRPCRRVLAGRRRRPHRRARAGAHALRRRRWPFYFFSIHAEIAGILLFTIVLMGAILLMRAAGGSRPAR